MAVESHKAERRHFHNRLLSRRCAPRFEGEVQIMSTFGLRRFLIAVAAFIGLALTTNPALAQHGGGGHSGGGGGGSHGGGGGFRGGGGGGLPRGWGRFVCAGRSVSEV